MATTQKDAPPAGARSGSQTTDRLLAAIHKISSLLTRPIALDTILTSIVRETSYVFGFTRMAIFLTDKPRNLLECRYIHGFNQEDTRRALRYPYRLDTTDCVETRVARLGKTIYVKDYLRDPRMTGVDLAVSQHMRRVSTIAVPLKIKKDVIGLIAADKDSLKLKLTQKDIKALLTFANQASIIIENARLQEQNQKKIKQLLTLQEISQQTSAALDLDTLFSLICGSALKLTRAAGALLFLCQDEQTGLSLAAAQGSLIKESKAATPWREAAHQLAQVVAATAAPKLETITTGQNGAQSASRPGPSALLAVPLINEKRVLGVLLVAADSTPVFSEDDLKLLLIFAGHSASLIRNVRLYGQMMTERNFRENILESSPNSMITLNLHQEITSLNRRAEEMFGVRRQEVLGQPAAAIFPGGMVRIIELALNEHAVVNRKEIRYSGQAETAAILGITSSLLRDHQNELIGAMVIARDLTEEKKTEELIHRIDRLTSLGQLSAGIAHEIRNPLASIYFNVQLMAKKLPAADPVRNFLNDTQEGINRIRALVKGMLDFAKPALPSLKNYPLARIVTDSIALMDSQCKKNKVTIAVGLADPLPDIVCDAHQIQQVLVNLLLNAIEAMPAGGRIDLAAWLEHGPGARSSQVALQCTDHGTGISAGHLSKIFNPFFTTKPEGTGLGLSIVHKILEQHHATVDVVSQEGNGTAFTLHFPVSLEEYPCRAIPS